MTKINRSQVLRMTIPALTALIIGLTSAPAAAQDYYSFFNRYTGAVLTTGNLTGEGTPLTTSIYVNALSQQWYFRPDTNSIHPGIQITSRVTYMGMFMAMDVARHQVLAGIPAVQEPELPLSEHPVSTL